MKAEYKEGPEARDNFERTMKALFKAPKTESSNRKRQPKKKATARKTHGKDGS